ncbi:hypothetical protein C162_20216 [Paenibacillus sp. FSL R7-269]|uniref:hypothetical protein n=1 Tax=Paenibacillus sp. FSL R7-269 TaxID=1226755 RepID=UPI0003E234A4|nr:hypothetical protein [Paenibacillus sp. FSL R7-269]ETT45695.1 hypothetical protein C162_20216 [Paenibacillus sp. FSL R7-269]
MTYTKTAWKDHIVDGSGAVVQQGTPLNAQNMNHLEEGVADAAAFTAGELGAATAYSGVLNHTPAIGYGIAVTAAVHGRGSFGVPAPAQYGSFNRFGYTDFHALIAGAVHEFTGVSPSAPTNNTQVLDPAPTEGSRDDLFFAEVWKDQDTQEWKRRLRVVSGVDFSVNTEGLPQAYNEGYNKQTAVTPQGGGTAPILWSALSYYQHFSRATNADSRIPKKLSGALAQDSGLYIAGDGSSISKATLKTYDGYVYAIPLAKIARRNSGGYSANNPNGAKDVKVVAFPASGFNIETGKTKNVTLTAADYALVAVGEEYYHASYAVSAYRYKIISKNGSNQVTVMSTGTGTVDSIGIGVIMSDRPDSLYSNIIAERDITDLRHKTYLVSPAYEQLLIDGMDQVLRGASQVERKTAMRKTYVGVRKTPMDANHVFYASFDGSTTPELGGNPGLTGGTFIPGFTGGAYKKPISVGTEVALTLNSEGSFEAWTDFNLLTGGSDYFMGAGTSGGSQFAVYCRSANTTVTFTILDSAGNELSGGYTAQVTRPTGRHHIRATFKSGQPLKLYIDGKLRGTSAANYNNEVTVTQFRLGDRVGGGRTTAVTLEDVAVSNIDRGATFATLPADFIQGYADITPALNFQRRINSDAQTSQKTYASAKVQNQTQERGITVTKGTGVNTAAWEAGDKIKVRGLAGEIVGGIIDADTALARVLNVNATATVLTLDDVSKIAVNDTIIVSVITDLKDGWGTRTVSAVDTTNKTITLATALGASAVTSTVPIVIYETTASTSSPVVRAIIAGTSTAVTGTWANLGTNEAELTLGTLPGGLAAQEIVIEYSLNMPVGQGSLYQIYAATLSGEVNGKKLKLGNVAITDDFSGKVTGSTTINPNKAYSAVGSTFATPSAPGTELAQADYDAIKSPDASLKVVTTNVSGQQAQMVISCDIIRAYEDKYGKIPGAYTTAEKVAWLKAGNLRQVTANISVYGTGPSGAHALFYFWTPANSGAIPNDAWRTGEAKGNSAASIAVVTHVTDSTNPVYHTNPGNQIDSNGFIHFLACADASDGVIPSVLYVDYFSIDLNVPAKTGYDTLVPENPRRDNGLAGVLYVRKTTREVESLFWGNDEDNGIVIYGDYLPSQEFASQASATLAGATNILTSIQGFITTAGTNAGTDGGINNYLNAISRLLGPGDDLNYKVDPQSLIGTLTFNSAGGATPQLRFFAADTALVTGRVDAQYTDGIPAWAAKAAEFLSGWPVLQQYNGELVLRVALRKRSQLASVGIGGGTVHVFFRLPGRPLVKI